MTLQAGKLRHRITIQKLEIGGYDPINGDDTEQSWNDVATVWAAVEPFSVREFIESKSKQVEVTARITIRYRNDLTADMRIVHKGLVYNPQGFLADKVSGVEYITIPVSGGVSISGQ